MGININPILTTTASGLFNTNSAGYTQGDAQDDPAVKFALCGGVLAAGGGVANGVIWAGLPIIELIPTAPSAPGTNLLGSAITYDTNGTSFTGFIVNNQAYGGVTTPQSTAPLFSEGMSVNYYRLGSGARIPVPCDPALVSVDGSPITSAVCWDAGNNWLTAYTGAGGQTQMNVRVLRISTTGNLNISYDGMTQFANWVNTGAIALILI